MLNVTRTIYGSALQTARNLGIPHDVLPYTTVNEALNDNLVVPYLPSVTTLGMQTADPYNYTNDSNSIKLQYFCIGNGGHRAITGAPGTPAYNEEIDHKSTDGGMYRAIPFKVVPVSNDLNPAQRAKFRLRRTVTLNGVLHAAYFGRVLDVTSVAPVSTITTMNNGQGTTTSFSPTINNLRPPIPSVGVANDGSFVSVAASVTIQFTTQDIQDIVDACALMYGNPNYAIISEIALVQGVDKPVTQQYPTTGAQNATVVPPGTYKEAIAAQIACFIGGYYSLSYANTTFGLTFDLGASEPLFGVGVS